MRTDSTRTRGNARRWFALMSLLILGCGSAHGADAGSDRSATLGDFHGRPTVDLQIGGQGPFTFILDTGAGVSVVDRGLQSRLGLISEGDTEIGSPVGGTVEAQRLGLPGVKLGEIELGEVEALAIDLVAMIGGEHAPVGVLATSAFKGSTLSIDFASSRLELSQDPLPEADGIEVFAFCSDSDKPSLTVNVGGQSFCVNVDTGSPGFLSLPLSAAETLPLASPPEARGRVRLVGADKTLWGARLDGEARIAPRFQPLSRP